MKYTHTKLAAITLSGLLVTAAGSALAFGGHHERHGDCDQRMMMTPMGGLARINDLSDEQKTQLQTIRKETQTAMRDLRDQMRDTKDDLRNSLQAEDDIDTIRQLAQKQGEQIAKMIVLRAETQHKIKTLLTETQRQQLQNQSANDFGWQQGPQRF